MIQIKDKQTANALNRLARETFKLKMLADINMDLMICEIENWDKKEYIKQLQNLINNFKI